MKKLPAIMVMFSNNGTAEGLQGSFYQGQFQFEAISSYLKNFVVGDAPKRKAPPPPLPSRRSRKTRLSRARVVTWGCVPWRCWMDCLMRRRRRRCGMWRVVFGVWRVMFGV